MNLNEKLDELKQKNNELHQERVKNARLNQELQGKINTFEDNKKIVEEKLLNVLELGRALDEKLPEAKKYQKRLEKIEAERVESEATIKENETRNREIESILDLQRHLIKYLEYYQAREALDSLILGAIEEKPSPELVDGLNGLKRAYRVASRDGENSFDILINRVGRGADLTRQ